MFSTLLYVLRWSASPFGVHPYTQSSNKEKSTPYVSFTEVLPQAPIYYLI